MTTGDQGAARLDRDQLRRLTAEERALFAARHPRSRALFDKARAVLPAGVPMSWMAKWPGGFPVYVEHASGAHFVDVDGLDYIDFCLGDTGAMTGHSPPATVEVVRRQVGQGITTMLPTQDATVVAEELGRRFGLPLWQFTLSATDANRHVIRYARHITGRPKVVVHDFCYHGSVDEAFATLDGSGVTVARRGNIGAPVPPSETTRVVPFNDVAALEEALSHGDVAAVLCEPALTNIGIVLPEPGYHEALREITRRHGVLLVIDETHTLCTGPGGYTAAYGLEPDFLTLGKAIAGGIPAGAFGMSEQVAERIAARVALEDIDIGGVGGTLAGNALSLAAMRVTLADVLDDEAFARMVPLAHRWADGVDAGIAKYGLAWHCSRLGARAEYNFAPSPPRDGAAAHAAGDFELEQFLHLFMLNRGLLLTPFHNMALMSPDTSEADVDRHTEVFLEALDVLTADAGAGAGRAVRGSQPG
ncbi:MAG: glutamate-semialdehyde -aminomutase [Actinomycetota bacterium]|jgi:glutamate-1-semialdehyde 2,1-aminomutase|nr:glutamate-semialdehyde -aminomutase [Actinomycetota bacterium]